MTNTDKRLEEKRTINPDTCCSECKRYGTTPSKFPIWCSDNNCSCHTSIHQALAEDRERMRGYITDEEKLLKISKNGAEEVIMNLRTRISSLDTNPK